MSFSDAELLILLLHNSKEHRIKGRTRFQKIVYLLKNQEINFQYEFRPYLYGPYSVNLKKDIRMLTKLGLLEEESQEIEFDGVVYDRYVYSLTEEGRQVAETEAGRFPEISGRLAELAADMEDLSTGSLILSSKYVMNHELSQE